MRVTQNTIFSNLNSYLTKNTQGLLNAQTQEATQKKINVLSDNPVDSGRVLDLNSSLSRSSQYLDNVERVSSLAKIQDSTIGEVTNLVTSAKSLLLTETNESTSTSDTREAARIEIAGLTSQLLDIANTRYDGQYVFSGTMTDTLPFTKGTVDTQLTSGIGGAAVTDQHISDPTETTFHNYEIQFTSDSQFNIVDTTAGTTVLSNQTYTSGDPIQFDGLSITLTDSSGTPQSGDVFTVTTEAPGVYQGNGKVQQIQIDSNTTVQQNVPGDGLFCGTGQTDGVNIFDTLNSINTALSTNDQTTMTTMLDQLDKALTQVSNEQSKVGARENLLSDVKSRQTDIQDNLSSLRSNLVDVDITDAIVELNKQQNLYDATLSAASKMVQNSLLDFLS